MWPGAPPHPVIPPECQELAGKGGTHQALRRQLRQLVHHAVRVVQHRNAAGRRGGVTLFAAPTQQRAPGGIGEGQSKQGPPQTPIRDTGGQPLPLPVLGSDVGHDVLVEELQDEWDAVGEDQMLGHVLKLGRKADELGQTLGSCTSPKPCGRAGPRPTSPGRCD